MERPIVTTSEGEVQGTTLKSVYGINYLAFRGIPYAQPPLGALRFKKPQPPSKWSGIRDASDFAGDMSMQYLTDGPKPRPIIGSEDCLYLNVYSNTIGYKRPVMFYIHGGGFVEGTANSFVYGEDYFMSQDVVLVSVNYRLGPMGFLNLGHEVAPGNQGLRDVILALKWVQKNIKAFGGDSDNVTIFGNSSGSTISHMFTMLPATKGLIHKAILQSGSMFMNRQMVTGKNMKNGFRIASLLGMDSSDPREVVEFLRTVPARKLVQLEKHIISQWENMVMHKAAYGPVVDAEYTNDPVIPTTVDKMLTNGAHVPIIIGHTVHESLLGFSSRFDDVELFKFYDEHLEDILRNTLFIKESSEFSEVMRDIREFYLKNQPITTDSVWNLVYLLSDLFIIMFNRKIIDLRNEHAKAPTYVYSFSYLGKQPTVFSFDDGLQPLRGVAHADELSYMFYMTYMWLDDKTNFPREGSQDKLVMDRVLRMWYNFAVAGNPTPKTDDHYITTTWKPSSRESLHYLDIGEELTLRDDKDGRGRAIYEKLSKLLFNAVW